MQKLLIVVDYQNDFVDGALGFPEATSLEKPICAKIEAYRASGADIVFTYDTHGADYLQTHEGKHLPVEHCLKGEPGWDLYGRVAKLRLPDDRCFYKPTFGSSSLFDFLRESQYESVELVGVVSNICVISNAVLVRTALPNATVMVDASCTAGPNAKLHAAALEVMKGLHIQVIDHSASPAID